MTAQSDWVVGDKWKTQHGHVYVVSQVNPDRSAMLKMILPFQLRTMKQKQIPAGWKKQP